MEDRRLLAVVAGGENTYTWFVADNYFPANNRNHPVSNGPAVAMNSTGDRVVQVFANGLENDAKQDDVFVREFTSDGVNLTLKNEFVIEQSTQIGGYTTNPNVSMDGPGNYYVVTWRGTDGSVRAATYNWNTGLHAGPATIAADIFINDRQYVINGWISVAMRQDSQFVAAWNTRASDSFDEAQARVFDVNLAPVSNLIPELNIPGEARNPVVAWSNHGLGDWDVLWTGYMPPPGGGGGGGYPGGGGSGGGGYPGQNLEGHFIQKYDDVSAALINELFLIPKTTDHSQMEEHYPFALSNDPAGNVGVVTKVGGMGNDPGPNPGARVRVRQPVGSTYQDYPGLPSQINDYPWNNDTAEMNATGLPAIEFDASEVGEGGVRSFRHFIVGSQRYVEGPESHWAWFNKDNGGSWVATGNVHDFDEGPGYTYLVQDMMVSPAINQNGNWWVFSWQYMRNFEPDPLRGQYGGWKIRAWDPPVDGASQPLAGDVLPVLPWLQPVVDRQMSLRDPRFGTQRDQSDDRETDPSKTSAAMQNGANNSFNASQTLHGKRRSLFMSSSQSRTLTHDVALLRFLHGDSDQDELAEPPEGS